MINFKVNQEKCVNCGLCSSDCPVLIINRKTEYPTIKEGKEDNCLECQHCLAVCPHAAISILGKEPENSISTKAETPKPIEMENLMKTRRSVRKFKSEDIDRELIEKLVHTAAYAPTAKNENSVHFTVVDSREQMHKLRELSYNQIKKMKDEDSLPKNKLHLGNFQAVWESKQIDVIFRDAPHLLITSAPQNGTSPKLDSSIAMTYFDILANSNGIGTLWNGFAKDLLDNISTELKAEIGIPEGNEVVAVLIFGKPKIKYARSIQNDNPNITKVSL